MKDFIDIGSSKGGSIRFAQSHFGMDGFGIDIREHKVAQAVKAGYNVKHMDIFDVEEKATWVTCLHTLEHLPSRSYCYNLLKKATEIADNVYLSFPYFDSDGYLYDLGYRFFWSRWIGHTLHLTRLELHNMLTDLNVEFKIETRGVVENTRDKAIVPLNAPVDVLGYDPETMDMKEDILLQGVYREVRCVIGNSDFIQ